MPKIHHKKHHDKKTEVKEETSSKNLRERITDMLQLPKDVLLNLPRISLIGNKEFFIENCKGIIEYTDTCVRVNTNIGVIKVDGRGLYVRNITSEEICIQGFILQIQFLR